MMIPDPGPIVIEVVSRAADPGITESDVIRWIGVTVAVAGIVLATPDGIAAAWRWVKTRYRRARVLADRLLRRRRDALVMPGVIRGTTTFGGRAYAEKWQPWRGDATSDEKIDILHKQVDILREEIGKLPMRIDDTADNLRNELREAEDRVVGQLRQLASEFRGERSQASRVDARGLGPIALGIILTGLADELSAVAAVGWLVAAVAIAWVALVTPSWLRDYRQALRYSND